MWSQVDSLSDQDLKRVAASPRRLLRLGWDILQRHPGYRWEAVHATESPKGGSIYSLRLTQKVRALAYRDGDLLSSSRSTSTMIRPTSLSTVGYY